MSLNVGSVLSKFPFAFGIGKKHMSPKVLFIIICIFLSPPLSPAPAPLPPLPLPLPSRALVPRPVKLEAAPGEKGHSEEGGWRRGGEKCVRKSGVEGGGSFQGDKGPSQSQKRHRHRCKPRASHLGSLEFLRAEATSLSEAPESKGKKKSSPSTSLAAAVRVVGGAAEDEVGGGDDPC